MPGMLTYLFYPLSKPVSPDRETKIVQILELYDADKPGRKFERKGVGLSNYPT
jgi:hypothetical protein